MVKDNLTLNDILLADNLYMVKGGDGTLLKSSSPFPAKATLLRINQLTSSLTSYNNATSIQFKKYSEVKDKINGWISEDVSSLKNGSVMLYKATKTSTDYIITCPDLKIGTETIQDEVIYLSSGSYLFSDSNNSKYFSNLKLIDCSNVDTSKVTSMSDMFYNCRSLTYLDISSFDMSNVTSYGYMFYNSYPKIIKTPAAVKNNLTLDGISLSSNLYMVKGGDGTLLESSSPFPVKATLLRINRLKDSLTSYKNATSIQFKKYSEVKDKINGWISADVSYYGNGSVMLYKANETSTDYIITCPDIIVGDKTFQDEAVHLFFGSFLFSSSDSSKYFSNLKSIDFSNADTSHVTNMSYMFYNCTSLTSLDLSNFNTSKVTSMNWMFSGCSKLTGITFPQNFGLPTAEDATNNMYSMFYHCTSLISLDLSNFNTSKVKNMVSMFEGCSSLISLDLSSFNTGKVTDMRAMFYKCSSLTSLNLSSFDTSSCIYMGSYSSYDNSSSGMFSGCSKLKTITFPHNSNLPTAESATKDMSYMFYGCSSLTSLDLSSFNTSNVTKMYRMFYNCSALTSVDLSSFNTSNVTSMYEMFESCRSLTSLNVSNFNTSNVTDMYDMFENCTSLTSLDLSSFNTSKVTNMSYMFCNCRSLTYLDISNFDMSKVTSYSSMFYNCAPKTIKTPKNTNQKTFDNLYLTGGKYTIKDGDGTIFAFGDVVPNSVTLVLVVNSLKSRLSKTPLANATKIYFVTKGNIPSGATTKITDVASDSYSKVVAYRNPSAPTIYYITCEDTNSPKVIFQNCNYLFADLKKLVEVTFNSSAISYGSFVSASHMFENCYSLTNIAFDGIFGNVKDMSYMFKNCTSFNSTNKLNLYSSFSTSNAKDLTGMFYGCTGLTSVGTSSSDSLYLSTSFGSYATNISYLFGECRNLTKVNLSSLSFGNVENASYMFSGCTSLAQVGVDANSGVILKSGFGANCTNFEGMFSGCSGLVKANLGNLTTTKAKNMSYMFSGCTGLTTAGNGDDFALNFTDSFDTSSVERFGRMFANCSGLVKIDLTKFNTQSATSFLEMFYGCTGLESAGFGADFALNFGTTQNFNTANVTDMSGMFSGCTGLANATLTDFNTAKVAFMNNMFANCDALISVGSGTNYSLNLGDNFVNGVTELSGMFRSCNNLQKADLTKFNLSETTDISYMFADCPKLASAGVGNGFAVDFGENVNTSKVSNMSGLFCNDIALTFIDLSKLSTESVTNMYQMFAGCKGLTTIGTSTTTGLVVGKNFGLPTAEGATNSMREMFAGCSGLQTANLTNFNTSKVTDMSNMFSGCSGFETAGTGDTFALNFGANFDTSNVKSFYGMFSGCSKLSTINLSNFSTQSAVYNGRYYYNYNALDYMFSGCTSLKMVGGDTDGLVVASGFGSTNKDATSMRGMFSGCTGLTQVDLTKFDMSKVVDMGYMFSGCTSLNSAGKDASNISAYALNFANIDTSNVQYMDGLFSGCSGLTKINLTGLNTTSVTDMSDLFDGCNNASITNAGTGDEFAINFGDIDTSKVTDMSYMFSNCSSLTKIDLTQLNTSALQDASYMFKYCINLKSAGVDGTVADADLKKVADTADAVYSLNFGENFATSSITKYDGMFSGCSMLNYLDISSFDVASGASVDDLLNTGYIKLETIIAQKSGNFGVSASGLGDKKFMYQDNKQVLLGSNNILSQANGASETPARTIILVRIKNFLTKNLGQYITDATFITFSNVTPDGYDVVTDQSGTNIDIGDFIPDSSEKYPNTMIVYKKGTNYIIYCDDQIKLPADMSNLFKVGNASMTTLQKIEFVKERLDDSLVVNASNMFSGCTNLQTVYMAGLKFSNCTNFKDMFSGCTSLAEVKMPNNSNLGTLSNLGISSSEDKKFVKSGSALQLKDTASVSAGDVIVTNPVAEAGIDLQFALPIASVSSCVIMAICAFYVCSKRKKSAK